MHNKRIEFLKDLHAYIVKLYPGTAQYTGILSSYAIHAAAGPIATTVKIQQDVAVQLGFTNYIDFHTFLYTDICKDSLGDDVGAEYLNQYFIQRIAEYLRNENMDS